MKNRDHLWKTRDGPGKLSYSSLFLLSSFGKGQSLFTKKLSAIFLHGSPRTSPGPLGQFLQVKVSQTPIHGHDKNQCLGLMIHNKAERRPLCPPTSCFYP